MDAVYINSTSFKVLENRTAEFTFGRRVKMDCDGVKYAAVVSSSFSSPYTTVVIDESDLTASLTSVLYGLTQPGSIGSLPNHAHDDSEGSGGTISGTGGGSSDVQSLLDLDDTPSVYDDGKYLISTTSGVDWTTISGLDGVDGADGINGADGADGADTTILGSYIKGVQSIKVEYATASGVYINPGIIDVNNVLYENETRTTLSGSFAADTWYYIYASGDGTNLSFTTSSGIPSMDYTKMGYYNGSDRCIGFVFTDASADIIKHHVDGGRYNYYEDVATTIAWQVLTADTDYDFDVHVPLGDMIVFMNVYGRGDTPSNTAMYIGTPAHTLNLWAQSTGNDSDSIYGNNFKSVTCNASKQLRTRADANFVARFWTVGFQIPDYIYNPSNFSQLEGGTVSGTLLQDGSTPLTADWNYGSYTISGTGDIYCNDIYTASGTVYIGDVQLTASGGQLYVDGQVSGGGSEILTLLDHDDTPAAYDYGKFLRSTSDGTRWAEVPAGTKWENGDGVPSGSLGDPYNYYLDITVGTVYTKTDLTYGSDQCSGGTASASSIYGAGQAAVYAFDNNTTTFWSPSGSDVLPNWLQYQFIAQKQIQKIRIRIRSTYASTRGPKDFVFKGSNTGAFSGEEVDIYSTTGATYSEGVYTEFTFGNADEYLYYRLHVTDTGSGAVYIDIAEMEMMEIDSANWELIYTPEEYPTTFSGLADTPSDYGTEGDYVVSTGSGIDFTQFPPVRAEGNWILVREINADNETINESIPWDGDTWPRAKIESSWTQCTVIADTRLRLNNDSGSNYIVGYITQDGTSLAGFSATHTEARYCLGSVHTSRNLFAITNLYLKSGARRFIDCTDTIYDSANTDRIISRFAAYWNNTSSNVTSIDISTVTNASGNIKIYRWRDITDIPVIKGKQSLQVEYATVSGIYINPGTIHMKDSYYGMYDLADRTEVTVSGLAVDTWYYVYTNVSGSTASLDETNFTVSSGVPTIDYPGMGYYNGDDRCIGFVYTDTSGYISRFKDTRGKYTFVKQINERPSASINGYEDVTHTAIPFGGMLVEALVMVDDAGSSIEILWPGDTSPDLRTNGLIFGRGGAEETIVLSYEVDNNKQIRFWSHASGVSVISDGFRVATLGFYTPDYIYTGA